ncbi:MAG: DNA-3-methyladenine glycosylase I [Kangiellaceae bacterium]|nr:DNA-3-methyladenine glycosylase I [Kangiellaceae bacterium]
MGSIIKGEDGKTRCSWCSATEQYIDYHDNEWGYPVDEDIRLFEKVCLESFQSGLSWRTILTKRENFRKAFKRFDYKKVAMFDEKDIERLLQDEGIVRHRGKIEAVINNAKRAIELVEQETSLAAYFWSFEPVEKRCTTAAMVSTSNESLALSKDLKKRGWKFVGPTTAYAFMQAMGLVNDHVADCAYRAKADNLRQNFVKPER